MDEFERLLQTHFGPLERFIKFRMSGTGDAEDMLQEVCLTAYEKYYTLRDHDKFKPWILQIARNKCRNYFLAKKPEQIPLDTVEPYLADSLCGPVEAVHDTLNMLSGKERDVLELTYFIGLFQAEIAQKLRIPVGTVKSRMHTAKNHFRSIYPYTEEGNDSMKNLPTTMPEYTITPSTEAPFAVRYEESPGWFIVPRLGEKCKWAMYDQPSKKRTMSVDTEAVGLTQIHGIEGVEIRCTEHNPVPSEQVGNRADVERTFVAQLTASHCRILAETHVGTDGVKKLHTFMDGDEFLTNWGYGPDNEGVKVSLSQKGIMERFESTVTMTEPFASQLLPEAPMDIVGRYTVTVDGKAYDTVLLMLVETWDNGTASVMAETYIDANGRTILWRRFNRNDWVFHHFGKLWTEILPDNERVTINGQIYVHWYDCITDYIIK